MVSSKRKNVTENLLVDSSVISFCLHPTQQGNKCWDICKALTLQDCCEKSKSIGGGVVGGKFLFFWLLRKLCRLVSIASWNSTSETWVCLAWQMAYGVWDWIVSAFTVKEWHFTGGANRNWHPGKNFLKHWGSTECDLGWEDSSGES